MNKEVVILNANSADSNYARAKAEADLIDEQIIAALKEGISFRVEAGAGSGKTYSLNKVIEWIQANRWNEYKRKKQNVVCITFTNAAVDVISERLSANSFIIPSTIHSFAWNAIKPFQSTLVQIVTKDESFLPEEGDFEKVTEVQYTLGHRYKEHGIQYLFHDDVLKLFCIFLNNPKFRRIFSDKYPLIFIDEYQDSNKPMIDLFIKYFIAENRGPQFGFFGDAWQTIYQSNNVCGVIEHENIKVIKKGSNFRSAAQIVSFLNGIRPELPQQSAIDDCDGEVIVVTCDDYSGERRTDRGFKDELPAQELKTRLEQLVNGITAITSPTEKTKVLMITHKVLATQQGYEKLLEILADGLRDKQDPFLLFFMNVVEPVFQALCASNMQLLFDTIGVKRYPITKKAEKAGWKALEEALRVVRTKRAIDVIEAVINSHLIPVPPQIEGYTMLYQTAPDTLYGSDASIKAFLDIEYAQFLSAISFLRPEASFSTEHGVKGEEYDNIVFVIGRGWNQYQFEIYAPMINGTVPIPKGKEASFERNRNLFYVCCSRPKKRLVLFITIPLDTSFRNFLTELIGAGNIYTYTQFLGRIKEEE